MAAMSLRRAVYRTALAAAAPAALYEVLRREVGEWRHDLRHANVVAGE
jgi:hypothetical protein